MRLRAALSSSALRARLAAEDGFTMLIALGVMTVVMLLVAAAFVAANGDIHNSQHDLDGKRAYYAARAGINTFLAKLNQDTESGRPARRRRRRRYPERRPAQNYSYSRSPPTGRRPAAPRTRFTR